MDFLSVIKHLCFRLLFSIDVINVYNVYKKILCKRVYYFVNVYLNKNHASETKQNYDGKPSYSALRTNRSLFEFIGSHQASATVTATKIISGQDNST